MAVLSRLARARKLARLRTILRPGMAVLEAGSGDGWLKRACADWGLARFDAVDLLPPADFVGDIRDWRRLGLAPASYDAAVAFELVEHAPCFDALRDLLKPGGLLFATSPAPRWDWACAALEAAGLSQRRTSPHSHLVDFSEVRDFELLSLERFGLLSQWGLFRKPHG